ncbi:TOBE domain-containing protein [Sulfurimonas sp.]|uniref:TOBE domain-containing protein n=1 Tax=Sulfurimonas sp. TaxID=2022749 RepID=UPI002AB1589D|nr:TOBE domain-containing protein [Sulfurimonas sp.]
MNTFKATITKIQNVECLNIVNFDFAEHNLSMMSLDLSKNLQVGSEVEVTAKSTHIAIAKNFEGTLSYSNQLSAKIISINEAQLLTSIQLSCSDTICESVITTSSSQRMNLQVNDNVTLLIKASELSIKRVL